MKSRVVITGLGMVSPLGLDHDSTWQGLINGRSGVNPISSFDTDGLQTTIAAEVKGFDPESLLGKKQARRMDRFVQLASAAAFEAKKAAGLEITPENATSTSIMISSGIGGIITLSNQIGVMMEKAASRVSPFLVPMMLPDMASGQVSIILVAKGPN